MLNMDHKAKIRHMVLVEGKSQRQVARETGHSRNTIRKMLSDSETPRYQQQVERRVPVLDKALLQRWRGGWKRVRRNRRSSGGRRV